MATCILCVLLGLVLGTVQDLLYDPETQNGKAASLIAQFQWCKRVVSSAQCKRIFAALESHLATDEFASSLHWFTQPKSNGVCSTCWWVWRLYLYKPKVYLCPRADWVYTKRVRSNGECLRTFFSLFRQWESSRCFLGMCTTVTTFDRKVQSVQRL